MLFAWSLAMHLIAPLNEIGVQDLPEDKAMIGLFRGFIEEPGVYRFPAKNREGEELTPQELATWSQRHVDGPTGILVYRPTGSEPVSTPKMAIELASSFGVALIVAMIVGRLSGRFGPKVLTVTLIGLLAWVEFDVSYWNWHGFSTRFVTASFVSHLIGWLLAAIAIVAIVKPVRSMNWTQKIPGAGD